MNKPTVSIAAKKYRYFKKNENKIFWGLFVFSFIAGIFLATLIFHF